MRIGKEFTASRDARYMKPRAGGEELQISFWAHWLDYENVRRDDPVVGGRR